MKRAFLAAAVLLAMGLASGASAKGSDAGVPSAGSFVPVDLASRVLSFSHSRVWSTTEGVELVCRKPDTNLDCRKIPTWVGNWTALDAISIPGHAISGLQFVPDKNGDQGLNIYFKRVVPK